VFTRRTGLIGKGSNGRIPAETQRHAALQGLWVAVSSDAIKECGGEFLEHPT